MRFGICIDVTHIHDAARVGFDYVEGKLNTIALLGDDEFNRLVEDVLSSTIAMERCCLLLPKSMQIIGKHYDEKGMEAYLHTAFTRMQILGSNLVVFGSGKSRTFDCSLFWQEAFTQLVTVTKRIGEIAQTYGISVAIEPLNPNETNLINTMKEGAALQAAVGLKNVGLLADAYHMRCVGEPWEVLSEVSPLMHTHIAVLEGRGYPTEASEEVIGFLRELKRSGYQASMSIEGKSDNWQTEGKKALTVLRSRWEEK
ncbi:MAG: sugar phosphate isomerase/epimerase family protein [Sphaerochaeta sp.]|jgi:D-psicose/D-tagatose/L-ribulose 3-epimerase